MLADHLGFYLSITPPNDRLAAEIPPGETTKGERT